MTAVWTAAQHDLVDYEVACAYANGYAAAVHDLAERADALDASWRPPQRRDAERVVADRVAAMERTAATQFGSTWRGRYPGGPVDYQTGRPRRREAA